MPNGIGRWELDHLWTTRAFSVGIGSRNHLDWTADGRQPLEQSGRFLGRLVDDNDNRQLEWITVMGIPDAGGSASDDVR